MFITVELVDLNWITLNYSFSGWLIFHKLFNNLHLLHSKYSKMKHLSNCIEMYRLKWKCDRRKNTARASHKSRCEIDFQRIVSSLNIAFLKTILSREYCMCNNPMAIYASIWQIEQNFFFFTLHRTEFKST